MTNQEFWLVWNPTHGNPQFRHTYLHSAKEEAERLARMHAPAEFFVLRAVSVTKKSDVLTIPLIETDRPTELPF